MQTETDKAKCEDMIRQAFEIHCDDVGHNLHQQALAWAFEKNAALIRLPTNDLYLKWATMK